MSNLAEAAVTESAAGTIPDAARTVTDIDTLVRTHLPLVGHIVRETLTRLPSHISRDDLISAGMYALAAAAKSFDTCHGVGFGSYAAIRIRGAITDELRSRDWASRSVRGKARELEQVRNSLAGALNRTPTRDEIATTMGVSTRELDAIDSDVHRASVLSLQALPVADPDDVVPAATDSPETTLLRREQLGYLHDAVAELPERLRTVIVGHFVEQRRMVDIAADLGVTESRVSQLRSEALKMLRAGMKAAEASDTPAKDAEESGTVFAARPITDLSTVRRARTAGTAAYYAAVAGRSTLAQRLGATNVHGEPTRPLAAPVEA
ncbi:sigma-70 family RNA polymerase sigma factor [Jatrophihabitans fulvus]